MPVVYLAFQYSVLMALVSDGYLRPSRNLTTLNCAKSSAKECTIENDVWIALPVPNTIVESEKPCGDQNPILIPVSGLTRLSARRASSAAFASFDGA